MGEGKRKGLRTGALTHNILRVEIKNKANSDFIFYFNMKMFDGVT